MAAKKKGRTVQLDPVRITGRLSKKKKPARKLHSGDIERARTTLRQEAHRDKMARKRAAKGRTKRGGY